MAGRTEHRAAVDRLGVQDVPHHGVGGLPEDAEVPGDRGLPGIPNSMTLIALVLVGEADGTLPTWRNSMIVDRFTPAASAAPLIVVSPRTSCNQISCFTDGANNLFARRTGLVSSAVEY